MPSLPSKRMIAVRFRIRSGEQLFAHEDRIGAGQETQGLRFVGQRKSSCTHADHRCRHQDARGGDRAHQFERIDFRCRLGKRRSFDPNQHIDGNAFGMRPLCGQLFEQTAAGFAILTHADDSAATDRDSGAAHAGERLEPVFVGSRGNDASVEFGRRVEIVVVGREAGLGKQVGLFLRSAFPACSRLPFPAHRTPRTISRI